MLCVKLQIDLLLLLIYSAGDQLEEQVSQPSRIGWRDQIAPGTSELEASTSLSLINVIQQSSMQSNEGSSEPYEVFSASSRQALLLAGAPGRFVLNFV